MDFQMTDTPMSAERLVRSIVALLRDKNNIQRSIPTCVMKVTERDAARERERMKLLRIWFNAWDENESESDMMQKLSHASAIATETLKRLGYEQ